MNIRRPARVPIDGFLREIAGLVNGVFLRHRAYMNLISHCAAQTLSRAQIAGQATAPTKLLLGTRSHSDYLYAPCFESCMRVRTYSGIGNQDVDLRYRAYQSRTYHRNLA
jgi:hypothetical protein